MLDHCLSYYGRYILLLHLHVEVGTRGVVDQGLEARHLEDGVARLEEQRLPEAREESFSRKEVLHFRLDREVRQNTAEHDNDVHVARMRVEHLKHGCDGVLVRELLDVRLAHREVQERQGRAQGKLPVLGVLPQGVHNMLKSIVLTEHDLNIILRGQVGHASHHLAQDVWAVPPLLGDLTDESNTPLPRNLVSPIRVVCGQGLDDGQASSVDILDMLIVLHGLEDLIDHLHLQHLHGECNRIAPVQDRQLSGPRTYA
mmetsp:Transcript_125605/g.391077  ORF Transcript_125605/g.391077 Transcript_125605/m.391077 type:complete len:257 (+) Transcript_125605:450-1220(+)